MPRKITTEKPTRVRRVATKATKRPPAVRDNVLGRRPSKSDPLGEQPGTVDNNQEQLGDVAPVAKPARKR